jgi:AraC-like DNA-binding protein
MNGDYYVGFRLWPFAANAMLGNRLNELVGKFGPLSELVPELASKIDVAGARGDREWYGLTQKVLLIELENGCSIDELARVATEKIVAISGRIKLHSLASELDVSLRQLQRRFSQATGIGLKQFARIRRFREAASELAEMTPRPWCHVAIEAGYSDQSHLTREFLQLVGLSPKQMQAKYDAIFHDLVDP